MYKKISTQPEHEIGTYQLNVKPSVISSLYFIGLLVNISQLLTICIISYSLNNNVTVLLYLLWYYYYILLYFSIHQLFSNSLYYIKVLFCFLHCILYNFSGNINTFLLTGINFCNLFNVQVISKSACKTFVFLVNSWLSGMITYITVTNIKKFRVKQRWLQLRLLLFACQHEYL